MSVSEEQILEKLTDIFRDILEVDDLNLTRTTLMEDIENWDSLSNVRIMVAIEGEFNIRFETHELTSVDGVAALIDFIEEKIS